MICSYIPLHVHSFASPSVSILSGRDYAVYPDVLMLCRELQGENVPLAIAALVDLNQQAAKVGPIYQILVFIADDNTTEAEKLHKQ